MLIYKITYHDRYRQYQINRSISKKDKISDKLTLKTQTEAHGYQYGTRISTKNR
jgi:hypothetical protein